ncbi:MAG: hypothetical protein LBU65_16735 [Planctomycetaceae bacterium]|jgi:hypothetical protein|nr:hypothetical protein [Planctomycetaceae bacterium]
MNNPSPTDDELRALHYYSWMLIDEKLVSAFLITVIISLCIIVWYVTASAAASATVFAILLLTVWRMLVPTHFEINADGIARWNFGRRRLIHWQEIKSYEIQRKGIMLMPGNEHYPLEPFHSIFIPIPEELEAEFRSRLRFFVDKITT